MEQSSKYTKTLINIGLLMISCITIIYISEAILYFIHSAENENNGLNPKIAERIKIAEHQGVMYDKRSRFDVVKDLRKDGINAYSSLFPSALFQSDGIPYQGKTIFPLSSVPNAVTVHCNESGSYLIINTDEYGFNNPPHLLKQENIDIALIGDSFVQGNCVRNEFNIAGWLTKSNYNVLNLGLSASGPLVELGILSEYAAYFKPKFVFWFYYEVNDLLDLNLEKKSDILIQYLNDSFSQNLLLQKEIVRRAVTEFMEKTIANHTNEDIESIDSFDTIKKSLKLYNLRSFIQQRFQWKKHNKIRKQNLQLFGKILKKAKDRVDSWGGHLYFVYLPSGRRFERKASDTYYNRKSVLSIVNQHHIPLIDINDVFMNYPNIHELFHYGVLFGHYNEKGYKLVADTIINCLQNQGM